MSNLSLDVYSSSRVSVDKDNLTVDPAPAANIFKVEVGNITVPFAIV